MPFSTGTYSAPASSFNPAVAATTISVTDWNALLADLTTALSTCVLKDGTQTVTADIPLSGYKLTGIGTATATGDAMSFTNFAAMTDYVPTISADTGTWGAATVTLARYKKLNKLLFLHLNISSTVSSGSPTEMRVLLPLSLSGINNTAYSPALVSNNGTSEFGQVRQSPSTYLSFSRVAGAVFTGACVVAVMVQVEVA